MKIILIDVRPNCVHLLLKIKENEISGCTQFIDIYLLCILAGGSLMVYRNLIQIYWKEKDERFVLLKNLFAFKIVICCILPTARLEEKW